METNVRLLPPHQIFGHEANFLYILQKLVYTYICK